MRYRKFAIRPHPFVPAFREQLVRLLSASPSARSSLDRRASTVVIARALCNSFYSALRSPPLKDVWWCFGAILASSSDADRRRAGDYSRAGQQPSSS